jgi:hypothetical protein
LNFSQSVACQFVRLEHSLALGVDLRTTIFLCIASLLSTAAAADDAASDNEIVDEITVMGVRDLGDLRGELTRAETEVYDLYNELNDDS